MIQKILKQKGCTSAYEDFGPEVATCHYYLEVRDVM